MFEYLLSWSHFDCCCVVQYCLEVSCCLVWYVMICTVVQYNSNVQSTYYTLSYTWVGWSNQIHWREFFIFIMCYWIRLFCILCIHVSTFLANFPLKVEWLPQLLSFHCGFSLHLQLHIPGHQWNNIYTDIVHWWWHLLHHLHQIHHWIHQLHYWDSHQEQRVGILLIQIQHY